MVRCISADVAVADGKWELREVLDNTGKLLPTMQGPVTVVTSRLGDRWVIEAYRYSLRPPATQPVPPTILKRPGYPGGQ